MKSKRTKALEISRKVKEKVWQRDGEHCVLCGRWVSIENACAHYIPRSQGGLGIEQNILTLCPEDHQRYDNGARSDINLRNELKNKFKKYLQSQYKDWNEEKLKYRKERYESSHTNGQTN